jgi:hypothetical protein
VNSQPAVVGHLHVGCLEGCLAIRIKLAAGDLVAGTTTALVPAFCVEI